MKLLSPDVANKVYDILCETCGANPSSRNNFVQNQTTDFQYEWRFCGSLGFGGKFKRDGLGKLWVTLYQEDATPDRLVTVQKANDLLGALQTR